MSLLLWQCLTTKHIIQNVEPKASCCTRTIDTARIDHYSNYIIKFTNHFYLQFSSLVILLVDVRYLRTSFHARSIKMVGVKFSSLLTLTRICRTGKTAITKPIVGFCRVYLTFLSWSLSLEVCPSSSGLKEWTNRVKMSPYDGCIQNSLLWQSIDQLIQSFQPAITPATWLRRAIARMWGGWTMPTRIAQDGLVLQITDHPRNTLLKISQLPYRRKAYYHQNSPEKSEAKKAEQTRTRVSLSSSSGRGVFHHSYPFSNNIVSGIRGSDELAELWQLHDIGIYAFRYASMYQCYNVEML